MPSPPLQIALITLAFLAGAVVDRLLLAPGENKRRGAEQSVERKVDPSASALSSDVRASTAVELARSAPNDTAAPRKSLETILATSEASQRSRDLQLYIAGLQPSEFADALKRLRQIASSNERELATRLLTAQWVMSDPEGALQFAAGNRGYDYLAVDVFRERAAGDFAGALRGAQEIPGNDLRYAALRGVLQFKADSDPVAALQLAQTLGEFRGREPLANAIYRQWTKADPEAAAAHAAHGPQGEGWRSPINQVANAWADRDPVAAAQWALSLDNAEARSRSVAEVMRNWSRDEPAAAANWIHSLAVGPLRDSAVAGFAVSIAASDPSTALGWIGTMSDEAERQRALRRVSRTVLWRDPTNGPALLQTAGISSEQIEALRRGRGR
ncbi:MAG: hypothetical protein ABIR71_11410 [Chthoniobacterales bacterium]